MMMTLWTQVIIMTGHHDRSSSEVEDGRPLMAVGHDGRQDALERALEDLREVYGIHDV